MCSFGSVLARDHWLLARAGHFRVQHFTTTGHTLHNRASATSAMDEITIDAPDA
jgi:hypothetical protein